MLESVLIANRGEIAARIVRACRDVGVRSIAVYSDADREAEHVRLADDAVRLGPPPVHSSYLSMDQLILAARKTGAAAIHPGYGLLSENAEFAERVAAAGIVFVGPTAEVIRLLGDKRVARGQAAAVGLTVLPARCIGSGDDAMALAAQIGYPLLVKAAFGGGGRGMRLVEHAGALLDALAQARRESAAAFPHADVYLEHFLPRARHVEVQVLADSHGNVRHLGTRDCTLQRRSQKLIEEAPAPGLSPLARERALSGSTALASRVGFHGAATVEFLLVPGTDELYFLEVNTRLQVEHTVTEMITGVDIVAAQLTIAAGEPIAFTQGDVRLGGHAIQARINAEDATAGLLPQTGRIGQLRWPTGPWVRTDTGVASGTEISTHYDSLLAKICAWGPDREAARSRLIRALAETQVDGVVNTAGFLTRVLENQRFRDGSHWTAMIDDGLVDTSGLRAPMTPIPAPGHRTVRISTPLDQIHLDIPVQSVQRHRPVRSTIRDVGAEARAGSSGAATGGVAPMDAVLVRHTVRLGEHVESSTTVAVVESMKMQAHVASGTCGVVIAIHSQPGDSVRRGDRLVTVQAVAE